jgi:DNA helicase-2/ATP-dependent DNA helicase PcrA
MHQSGGQNLKEEKRLLFVAMTRGKNIVEIGWHAQPTMRKAEPAPSYFLNDIPEALLHRRISAASSELASTDSEVDEWSINSQVQHKKYGVGIIILVEEKELTCSFESVGEKSFSKAFAKMLLTKTE